jgi:X-X-X-Leu-X-X-Gly heptad repeat protein
MRVSAVAPAKPGSEDLTMRQLLLVVLGLAAVVAGCATHSLVPTEQALAIKNRDRALAPHAAAIQDSIRQSDNLGALVFLDARDGHLVVLPGASPADAWARYLASPSGSPTNRASVPPVVSFVHRADVPKAPEGVTSSFLQEQETLRTTLAALAALDTELRKLSDAVVAARRETQTSIATARADMQKALDSLAEELAAARKFMLQTAQVGTLNQEMNVENANGIRKLSAGSQQVSANAAKLADTMRQLSDSLASQLKELAARLDAIQNRISDVK